MKADFKNNFFSISKGAVKDAGSTTGNGKPFRLEPSFMSLIRKSGENVGVHATGCKEGPTSNSRRNLKLQKTSYS